MIKTTVISICAVFLCLSAVSLAADNASPSSNAYMEAMAKMNKAMPSQTGDPDVDFVQMMIPHHQAALEMAKAELKFGKDAKARAMAEKLIEAQEKEIAELEEWLKAHPK